MSTSVQVLKYWYINFDFGVGTQVHSILSHVNIQWYMATESEKCVFLISETVKEWLNFLHLGVLEQKF